MLCLLLNLHQLEPTPNPGPPPALRRSTRIAKPPDRFGFPSFLSAVHAISIPSSYSQAVQESCWQEAMADEIVAFESNQSWDLVPHSESGSVIGSKKVFSIKVKPNGTFD